jgi:DNA invertase Pin-like site-specific DNA recombinase
MEDAMNVGYARVSSGTQDYQAQIDALKAVGVERIYSEKESGAKTDRRELAKALAALGNGDVLVVCKLDRLARSTRDLLNTLDAVTKAGAGFKVLDNPSLDTTCAHGKLLLSVLGAIAEFERSMIRSRCSEGIVRAKANGIAFGRKPKLSKFQIDEAKARLAQGETTRDIARTFGVSHSTISRLG